MLPMREQKHLPCQTMSEPAYQRSVGALSRHCRGKHCSVTSSRIGTACIRPVDCQPSVCGLDQRCRRNCTTYHRAGRHCFAFFRNPARRSAQITSKPFRKRRSAPSVQGRPIDRVGRGPLPVHPASEPDMMVFHPPDQASVMSDDTRSGSSRAQVEERREAGFQSKWR